MKPFPPLVLKTHQNVVVVRDDLFPYGSKARFLDDYFATIDHKWVVYGSSPRWGFAQISVAYLAKRHGKKAVVFLPKASVLSSYSKRAAELGAEIIEVPMGFLSVCESKARKYADERAGFLLPCGLDCPEAITGVVEVVSGLPVDPDEVWSVASSGTLTRGLQRAYPDADFFAVRVGKSITQKAAGRATIIEHPLPFGKPTKKPPPFPSVPEYDAKAWEYIPKDGNKVRLFWNVGA